MPTNLVRIHAGNFPQISVRIQVQLWLVLDAKIWSWLAYSKTVTKKDSVVLLVAWTLSIRGSLCIWYSLQITLRLRGATPTNRHPLQSCGFSREILWHSCLEVVMNLYFNDKVCWKQYICLSNFKIFRLWVCSEIYDKALPSRHYPLTWPVMNVLFNVAGHEYPL